MKMTITRMTEIANLLSTLREMGFNTHEDTFELFAEDGTDVFVSFTDNNDILNWTVNVNRDAAGHHEEFVQLRTREVEDILNHIGLYGELEMNSIMECYQMIVPYTNRNKNPREEAEALYQTGIMDWYTREVRILAKQYEFLQHTLTRSIQFDRVVRNLLAIHEEQEWRLEKMDI